MTGVGRAPRRQARYAAAFAVAEFRAIWASEMISVFGDQLARIALAFLVYDRTSNATATAITYGLTFLPSILGGWFLADLADRVPRRRLLLVIDCGRAVVAVAMAWPAMPTPALWGLAVLLFVGVAPYKGAQKALLRIILRPEDDGVDHSADEARWGAAVSLRQISTQGAQVVGFLGGGLLLAVAGPAVCLLINAATFACSVALVATRVTPRPAPPRPTQTNRRNRRAKVPAHRDARPDRPRGVHVVIWMSALTGLYVAPEGIAPVYAHGIHTGVVGLGFLMAADPVGSVLGAWLAKRSGPRSVMNLVILGALAGVPLIACWVAPTLWWSVALWATCGAVATLLLVRADVMIPLLVPNARRGATDSRRRTGLDLAQGLAVLAGGVVASRIGPVTAVAATGVLGVLVACVVGGVWRATRPRVTVAVARPAGNVIRGSKWMVRSRG